MSFALDDRHLTRPAAAGSDSTCELAGMRLQLMNALSHVQQGALLVYRLRPDNIESEAQRMLGGFFVQKCNWLSGEIEPLFVPGTLCPEVIGNLLRRFGWVMPAEQDEGGYLRNFILSEAGEKALENARAWWDSLTWFQKAWLYVAE